MISAKYKLNYLLIILYIITIDRKNIKGITINDKATRIVKDEQIANDELETSNLKSRANNLVIVLP